MSTIVTRSGKGAALTHVEVDANFTNLNTDKAATTDVILGTQKGAASGVCPLDSTSKVSSTYLPSYVDDVLEYANLAALPVIGETGKIYVALDTNKTYRWSGSAYIYITSGAVDSVAGRTGVVTLTSTDVGLANASNTSDANKPVSTATQTALDLKSPLASPTFTGTTTAANLAYTGTLTGGTGIINIGSGQVYKDASGNVGIGTSSPNNKLTVGAPSAFAAYCVASFSGANVVAVNTSGMVCITSTDSIAANIGGSIGFAANGTLAGYPTGSIAGRRENATAGDYSSYMQFNTSTSGGTVSERMRIDSSGNVGIGTISPAYKLDVTGSSRIANGSSPTAYIQNTNSAGFGLLQFISDTSQSSYIWQNGSTAAAYGGPNSLNMYVTGVFPITFATNALERLRIDSSGNVGIGTTVPNASAILDAQSTTKGVRFPNMTTTQKTAVATPAAGLVVFDTTLAKLCVYSGAAWQTITSV